jgi:surface protein
LFVVGWSFLLFVAPSLAVFYAASAFNQDVSKWSTGAVTTMSHSKCTLSPSPWPRLPLLYFLNIRQLECHRITILTRFIILLLCFLTRYLFCFVCGGLVFLFFVAPSLAVFYQAKKFNQDVSKWNTGAVNTMASSKCTLSPSLYGHAFRCCVFEYLNIQQLKLK